MRKPVTWVVLAVFLLAGALWLTRDEPASEEIRSWQSWHDDYLGEPGQAWLWLMGLQAPVGDRPDEAGRQWLALDEFA